MAIQYAIIDGLGCRMFGWDWQFDDDQFDCLVTPSYSVWIVPGTSDPMED